MGQRGRLLRGGWSEGADAEDPAAYQRPARTAPGQLRTIPAQRADAGGRVGQDDARALDAQLRRGGEGFSGRLRHREVSGERELYRGQPRESEAVDGAAT